MGIVAANRTYEGWLSAQLKGALVKPALKAKHEKMSEGPFAFLRATYWRWAETILTVCPDLANAPAVPAVGDTHLENFGTWRDDDGRLVWGVNDFDEAAQMPYPLDIVRLAVSAALAAPGHLSLKTICAHVLDGYARGLEAPAAFVLDRDHLWLRQRFNAKEKDRAKFWRKINDQYEKYLKKKPDQPPTEWLPLFGKTLPEPSVALAFWPHTAGTGSLGRPRWLGYGTWRDGPLLREGKALVTSGWTRAHGGKRLPLNAIARGCYRAPDPWYHATGNVLMRRLSANNRKLEVKKTRDVPGLLHPTMLGCMGRDLAAVHLGLGASPEPVRADLDGRPRGWLRANAETAMAFVSAEHAEWRDAMK